jgi:3-phosphoshikimate 1-carboxyvinyltransferase
VYTTPFLDIPALDGVSGRVRLPGSKSISNRVLLMAALCPGKTVLHNLLHSDDTHVMLQALDQLGCALNVDDETTTVNGLNTDATGPRIELFLGNAGTAMRPLTAALALRGGEYTLSGTVRMHQRPIGDLVDALNALGCRIDYLGQTGFPPLRIRSPNLDFRRPIRVRGDVSSQFLTALLIALPTAGGTSRRDIEIEVVGELISKPYVEMTLNLLARFGVDVRRDAWKRFVIPGGSRYYSPGDFQVEPDASSASYLIAAAALSRPAGHGAGLIIEGIGTDSIQGDIRFIQAAERMGARIESAAGGLHVARSQWPLRAIDLDCNAIPDAAMTLAMMALYADGPSTLRNVASWRVKETDRLAAMATELRKLGAAVEEGADRLTITPPATPEHWRAATWRTYDDHRMAMCGALAAFNPAQLPIRIDDPACVGKTFPDYFETLFQVARPATSVPVICIDGPSASGKGTLASGLARALGYHYLDSGALYRLLGLAARRHGLAPPFQDAAALGALAKTLPVRFHEDRVWLGAEDVTHAIRSEQAGRDASLVSAVPEVRTALLHFQREAARLPGLVADGRDMGTVVFPRAPLKVFLTADVAERAKRRAAQLRARGVDTKIDSLYADLVERDARDRARTAAPLKPAEDALPLDNSHLSIEQSVAEVLSWWQKKQPFRGA